ncbi:MAG: Plug domain-containing protein [Burkholderiales bacterium]
MSLTNTSQPKLSAIARAVALTLATAAIGTAVAQTATDKKDDQAPRAKEDTVRLGTITIVGQGDKLGAGQILNEDAVKGRSTVTKEASEKDRTTGNTYQALSILPGINTYNHDATGLFGGGLTIRGFGADQIGFTINGVPVNDSGSYSVFPQEYSDMENTCLQSVAQGTPDVESPHIGATGGSISVNTCDPIDTRRVRVTQTVGQLNLSRTFVRFDSWPLRQQHGEDLPERVAHAGRQVEGEGGAKRDHVDAAFCARPVAGSPHPRMVNYNKAVNNNFRRSPSARSTRWAISPTTRRPSRQAI